MALSEAYTGSYTVTTEEYSLPNAGAYSSANGITTDGIYQVFLDLSAIAAGDEFELKVYEKATSGGTQRLCYIKTFAGTCAMPINVTPSLILLHGWDVTLKKIAGTDRSLSWSIRKAA
jgi:hypothetical protein